jgi:hypothetical protein
LYRFSAMLVALAVAATVLASPAPPAASTAPPKGAVFLVIDAEESAAGLARARASAGTAPRPDAFLGGLLGQFAVVKPHRAGPDAPPSLQLFVLLAPMNGLVGVHAVGSF